MVALSVSISKIAWSIVTSSPSFIKTCVISAAAIPSPRSGIAKSKTFFSSTFLFSGNFSSFFASTWTSTSTSASLSFASVFLPASLTTTKVAPMLTFSPSFTSTFSITPSTSEGTSITALSVSISRII